MVTPSSITLYRFLLNHRSRLLGCERGEDPGRGLVPALDWHHRLYPDDDMEAGTTDIERTAQRKHHHVGGFEATIAQPGSGECPWYSGIYVQRCGDDSACAAP